MMGKREPWGVWGRTFQGEEKMQRAQTAGPSEGDSGGRRGRRGGQGPDQTGSRGHGEKSGFYS